jgi:aspartyl/asparaginyl-tRNA synthetase
MQKVLQAALLISLVGLFSLTLLAEFYEPEQIQISELNNYEEKIILIQGRVIKSTQKPDVNFFEVQDSTGTIAVVAFGQMDKLCKDANINVKGKVTRYKGELEIIANKVILL